MPAAPRYVRTVRDRRDVLGRAATDLVGDVAGTLAPRIGQPNRHPDEDAAATCTVTRAAVQGRSGISRCRLDRRSLPRRPRRAPCRAGAEPAAAARRPPVPVGRPARRPGRGRQAGRPRRAAPAAAPVVPWTPWRRRSRSAVRPSASQRRAVVFRPGGLRLKLQVNVLPCAAADCRRRGSSSVFPRLIAPMIPRGRARPWIGLQRDREAPRRDSGSAAVRERDLGVVRRASTGRVSVAVSRSSSSAFRPRRDVDPRCRRRRRSQSATDVMTLTIPETSHSPIPMGASLIRWLARVRGVPLPSTPVIHRPWAPRDRQSPSRIGELDVAEADAAEAKDAAAKRGEDRRNSWYAPPTIGDRYEDGRVGRDIEARMRLIARQRDERVDARAMPVVEHEVRGQRPVRLRQGGVIGARDGALRVREALDLGAVSRPQQETRGFAIQPSDRPQLGVEVAHRPAIHRPWDGGGRGERSRSRSAC